MGKRKLSEKVNDFFGLVLNDPDRKSIPKLLFEYSKFLLFNPNIAEQYFYKFLYRRSVINPHNYLITRQIERKCWNLNDRDYISILENKHLFELFFFSHNLSVVKGMAYNINTLFFLDNNLVQVNTPEDFIDFMSSLPENATGNDPVFIKKIEGSSGGKNIFRETCAELNSDKSKLLSVFNQVISAGYIFQKEIRQHEELNRINPACLNTLRIDTFTDNQRNTKAFSCHLKVGTNKSHVDNISSGGAYVGLDMHTGTLYAEAFTNFSDGRGKRFSVHPITRFKFEGFRVPFINEAIELATEAAKLVPQIKLIGWDVAIQPDGPILIEGNDTTGLVYAEIGQKGFFNNMVVKKMLQEANMD